MLVSIQNSLGLTCPQGHVHDYLTRNCIPVVTHEEEAQRWGPVVPAPEVGAVHLAMPTFDQLDEPPPRAAFPAKNPGHIAVPASPAHIETPT